MAIKYSVTYEIITEESAEHGEDAESGFLEENADESLRGMVDLLRGTEPSCWPLPSVRDGDYCGTIWFTVYGESDFRTGEVENRSYHPATSRDARYMVTAWKVGNGRAQQ